MLYYFTTIFKNVYNVNILITEIKEVNFVIQANKKSNVGTKMKYF